MNKYGVSYLKMAVYIATIPGEVTVHKVGCTTLQGPQVQRRVLKKFQLANPDAYIDLFIEVDDPREVERNVLNQLDDRMMMMGHNGRRTEVTTTDIVELRALVRAEANMGQVVPMSYHPVNRRLFS